MEEEGKTREEHMYWNILHVIRFHRTLGSNFSTQLELPNKFYRNMMGKLPSKVTLKGPGGVGATWNVHLAAKNDKLFFQDGWEAFARAYSLTENGKLDFFYDRNSCFDVLIYDGKSGCESYFVENTGIGFGCSSRSAAAKPSTICTPHNINKRKRTRRESINRSAAADAEPTTAATMMENSKSAARRSVDVGECSRRKPKFVILSDEDDVDNVEAEEDCNSDSDRTWRINEERTSTGGTTRQRQHFSGLKKPSLSNTRNPATTEEQKMKAKAKNSSSSTLAKDIKTPTNRLCIPAKWARKHLGQVHQDIFLQHNGKKRRTRYNYSESGTGSGIIFSGWKEFALENFLHHRKCIFKLNPEKHHGCAVLDVSVGDSSAE